MFVTLKHNEEDANLVKVKIEDQAILICKTLSKDIKACAFVDPSGERRRFAPDIKYEYGRLSYFGEYTSNTCGLKIDSTLQKDIGIWRYVNLLSCR